MLPIAPTTGHKADNDREIILSYILYFLDTVTTNNIRYINNYYKHTGHRADEG
jgi:hypothetical protein